VLPDSPVYEITRGDGVTYVNLREVSLISASLPDGLSGASKATLYFSGTTMNLEFTGSAKFVAEIVLAWKKAI
jgi:hypothetical protein